MNRLPEEQALIGAKEIARYLRWSIPRLHDHSKEMQEGGFIIKQCFGRPPNRSYRLTSFPSLLQKYLILNQKF